MRAASNQQQLNDDGTPRRKYELDEQESGKYVLRATIGFVLANAFILVKNVLFGAETASKPPLVSVAAIRDGADRAGEQEDGKLGEERYGDSSPPDDEPDGNSENSGFVKLLYTTSDSYQVFGDQSVASAVRITSSVPAHGNDNIALYGAVPGRSIALFSSEGGHNGLPHFGGDIGGSSGGAPSGGANGTRPPGPVNGGDTAGHGEPGPGDSSDEGSGVGGSTGGSGGTGPGPLPRTNRLPVVTAPVILSSLLTNQSVVIALSEFLRNVSDPDGDQLSVRDLSTSSGKLEARIEGGWTFTPDYNDTSNVTFAYSVSDGIGSTPQIALLDLVPVSPTPIMGTDGNDTLIGTPYDDVIDALCGDDIVLGREGDDVIFGGDGNDRIVGGDGNDVIYAGAGDDVVFGGAGNDVIFGGTGNDLLFGDDGNDVLVGEEGNDTLWGGAGNDILTGGAGDDALYGGDGDDFLDGGTGHNYLDGGPGNDTLIVHTGDVAKGGAGPDTFVLVPKSQSVPPQPIAEVHTSPAAPSQSPEPPKPVAADVPTNDDNNPDFVPAAEESSAAGVLPLGNDVAKVLAAAGVAPTADTPSGDEQAAVTKIAGGPDEDTLDASALSAHLTVNLDAGAANSSDTGFIEIANVENVIGGSGSNILVGSDVANKLTGGASHDVILGEGGDDQIHGGKSDDILAGGKDADAVYGDDGDDVIVATKDDSDDHYDGGDDDDTYDASLTSADLKIDLEKGTSSSSETGHDTLANIENVRGGSGNDTIVANEAVNTMTGGEGEDTFVFGSVAAIGKGAGQRDKILDFAVGDRIDLDKISDDFVEDLEQAFGDHVMRRFVLIGEQDTFAVPGQMKVRYEDLDGQKVTILEGNVNHDAAAEFELEFLGFNQLRDNDFARHH